MAVCNLFKKMTKKTGNFMMFSQYVEDLTKSTTQPGFYRVVPSKFIAMNIDFKTIKDTLNVYDNKENDMNKSFPLFVQGEFENGCALMREEIAKGNIKEPDLDFTYNDENGTEVHHVHWSTTMFWDMMRSKLGLVTETSNVIKYIGDINLQSFEEHAGMGYNEIFCFIPSTAKEQKYSITFYNELQGISNTGKYLVGFEQKDDNILDWTVKLPVDSKGETIKINYMYGKTMVWKDMLETNEEKFEFNAVVLLYDVKCKDKTGKIITYKENTPMGIYFPGLIDNKTGKVSNTQCKYVNNDDIYDSGTSYGLKICSRFTASPNSDGLKVFNVETKDIEDDSTFNTMYCNLMALMADTLAKMDEILNQLYLKDKKYNELYNLFKNSRTNVPYVKQVNGLNCWFVNGRNLGPVETSSGLPIKYDNTDNNK